MTSPNIFLKQAKAIKSVGVQRCRIYRILGKRFLLEKIHQTYTDKSRFKKLRFNEEFQFKKDCYINQNLGT